MVGGIAGGTLNPLNRLGGTSFIKDVGIDAALGGVTGALAAEEGERLEGASEGSLWGAGLGAGMRGLQEAGNVALKLGKDIGGKMVDAAGNFIPVHLAADDPSLLRSFYQKIVSNVPGGGDVLMKQQRAATDIVEEQVETATDAAKIAKRDAIAEVRTEQKRAKQLLAEEEDTARRALKLQSDQAKEQTETALTKTIDQADAQYRAGIVQQSLPEGATPEQVQALTESLSVDPQASIGELHQLWNANGFRYIKDADFVADAKSIYKSIADKMPSSMKDSLPTIKRMVDDYVGKATKSKQVFDPKTGALYETATRDIKGDDLMNARNEFRYLVNNMGDDSKAALEKAALARAADEIDDVIRKQLDPKLLDVYESELTRWGNFLTTRGAAGRAGTTKGGRFDADDILASERSQRGAQFSEGKTPLRRSAQAQQVARKGLETQSKQGLDRSVATLRRQAENVGQPKSVTNQQKNHIDEQAQASLEAIELRTMRPDAGLKKINEQLEDFRRKAASDSKTPYQAQFAIAALSAMSIWQFGIGSTAGAIVTAYGIGHGLARPGMQRYLAGQTGWQQAMTAAIRGMEPAVQQAFLRGLPQSMREEIIAQQQQDQQQGRLP